MDITIKGLERSAEKIASAWRQQNKIRKDELKMKIVEVGLHYHLIDEEKADQIMTELLQSIDNI